MRTDEVSIVQGRLRSITGNKKCTGPPRIDDLRKKKKGAVESS